MARGRKHVPPSTSEGIWFNHRGAERSNTCTVTQEMLAAPFRSSCTHIPRPPPSPFRSKTEINYKSSNKFSEHDNRHSFQTHGVYLGDGRDTRQLGRRNITADLRIHHTEKDFFKHSGIEVTEYDYRTTYGNSFLGDPTQNPPTLRRFRKSLPPPKAERVPIDTTATDWFQPPMVPFRTPTHVLAISQEPFLKHNAWKYSNHSLKNVYPPYETRSEPMVKNTFNKYGAAFRTFASEPTNTS